MAKLHVLAVAALATVASFTVASEASADDKHPRVFGLGTAFGGGYGAVAVSFGGDTVSGGTPLIYLPTLEAQFFIPDTAGWSIDASLPITNIAIVSAALGGLFFEADAFLNFNPGGENVRLVAGPGIGFSAYAYDGYGFGGIRIPAEVGLELLSTGQNFSFKVMARPFFEVFFGDFGGSAVGGGATGMLGFSGNVTP